MKKLRKWFRGWRGGMSIAIASLLVFTGIQFYGLYQLDLYLSPSKIATSMPKQHAAVKKKPTPEPQTVPLPTGVKLYAYGSGKTELAYVNADQQLVIKTAKSVLFQQAVGDVTNLQWLSDSGTLLYFVQNTDLNAYLLQQSQKQPVLIGQFSGSNLTVKNVYFSPYLEYMYIELDEGGSYDAIYKYDAVIGMKQLPLGYVKIANIQYNAKQDIMTITDFTGTVWQYKNDQLTRG